MIAVCNTSPLILLAKIHRLDLLCRLYHPNVVPTSVLAEATAKSGKEADRIETLAKSGQCHVSQASSQAVQDLPDDLGPGERETIALALEIRADLVIVDDQKGRRVAREKGLTVTQPSITDCCGNSKSSTLSFTFINSTTDQAE